jgi:hypothetical protein
MDNEVCIMNLAEREDYSYNEPVIETSLGEWEYFAPALKCFSTPRY